MARVQEVIVREMPPGPSAVHYGSKEAALKAEPGSTVVDAVFATQDQARSAARRVNAGLRGDWPKELYYAVWAPNPNPSDPDENGIVPDAWELRIAWRGHGIPEEWQRAVNAPGFRKRRKAHEEGVDETDSQDVEDDENEDVEEEEEEEHRQPVAA